ncbi:MAG: hypothetical protein V7752_21790 [Halopseudomonas sp.]
MTNLDIKRELDLVHQGLIDLKCLCSQDGLESVMLDSFVRLIGDRFEDVKSELESMLRTMDLLEVSKTQGKEAAIAMLDTWGKDLENDSNSSVR